MVASENVVPDRRTSIGMDTTGPAPLPTASNVTTALSRLDCALWPSTSSLAANSSLRESRQAADDAMRAGQPPDEREAGEARRAAGTGGRSRGC